MECHWRDYKWRISEGKEGCFSEYCEKRAENTKEEQLSEEKKSYIVMIKGQEAYTGHQAAPSSLSEVWDTHAALIWQNSSFERRLTQEKFTISELQLISCKIPAYKLCNSDSMLLYLLVNCVQSNMHEHTKDFSHLKTIFSDSVPNSEAHLSH